MHSLKRTLGVASLCFYGVGIIIGAGIYSVIGAAAGEAGRSLWIAVLIAALPAGLAALSYAELASIFRVAGGEFLYLRRAFPKRLWLSTMTGALVVFAAGATSATVSQAFGGYLERIAPVPIWVSAVGLILLCTGLNIAGIRIASWANIILTLIELAGLVIIIGAGVRVDGWTEPLTMLPDPGVFAAAAIIFFIYTGFESIVNLSEEAKEPKRDVPRALLISFGITLLFYVLVALAAVALLPPEDLADSDAPLADAAATTSPVLATALSWIAMFSTANTALVSLIAASRLAFAMGRKGALPPVLSRTLPGRKTPWAAALTLGGLALVLLPVGGVSVVASVSSFASLTAFISVALAVIALRKNEPDLSRGFRLRPSIGWVPIWPALQILVTLALMTQFKRVVYYAGGAGLAVALALYLCRGLWGGIRPPDDSDDELEEPGGSAPPGPGPGPGAGPPDGLDEPGHPDQGPPPERNPSPRGSQTGNAANGGTAPPAQETAS